MGLEKGKGVVCKLYRQRTQKRWYMAQTDSKTKQKEKERLLVNELFKEAIDYLIFLLKKTKNP
jgi:hypothetical protein